MKTLFTLSLLCFFTYLHSQERRNELYFGIFSSGSIAVIDKDFSPTKETLRYTTVSFNPKLGFRFKNKLTVGVIGEYSFANSTLNRADPSYGGGYFVKYNFSLKKDSTRGLKGLSWFGEWLHTVSDGFYAVRDDNTYAKIKLTKHRINWLGGIDYRFKFGLSLSLGIGLSFTNNFNNPFKPENGQRIERGPAGLFTIQYNLKL
jgi:hypothetical protein